MAGILVALVTQIPQNLFGAETLTVSPEQLAGLVKNGQKVKLVLKTGTYGEGKVQEVSASQMVVNITKSHNASDLPTSTQGLALDRVASVTVSRYKGNKRTWLPAILCSTLGSVSLWMAYASEERASTYVPAAAAFTGSLAAGGYFVGRALDRDSITYIVK